MPLLRSAITALVVSATLATPVALAGSYGKPAPSIVSIASNHADFETLTAALKAADLVTTLEGEGPFTVFAPTDAAFDRLPEGTLSELLKPENKDKLRAVLTYHVVPGTVKSDQVVKLDRATTVNGKAVSIAVEDGAVKVDGATVTSADIVASNGVIHVIDRVILPN